MQMSGHTLACARLSVTLDANAPAATKGDRLSTSRGCFFMVVGPPGVGKNTLIDDALGHFPWLQHLATCTTRSPRPGEQECGKYQFVSLSRFHQMIADGELLEWQEVHPGRYYGVPRAAVERALGAGQHLITDLDVLGATCLQTVYPENVVFIFINPPAPDALVQRMRARGDSEQDIQSRIQRVHMELQYADLADHLILNDDLQAACDRLRGILSDRMRQLQHNPGEFQRRHYESQLLVSDGARALISDESGQLPFRALRKSELPQDAALRCLQDLPDLTAGCLHNPSGYAGSFLPPVAVAVERGAALHVVRLTWVYRLTDSCAPAPPGWRWQNLGDIELPGAFEQSAGRDERLAAPSP